MWDTEITGRYLGWIQFSMNLCKWRHSHMRVGWNSSYYFKGSRTILGDIPKALEHNTHFIHSSSIAPWLPNKLFWPCCCFPSNTNLAEFYPSSLVPSKFAFYLFCWSSSAETLSTWSLSLPSCCYIMHLLFSWLASAAPHSSSNLQLFLAFAHNTEPGFSSVGINRSRVWTWLLFWILQAT